MVADHRGAIEISVKWSMAWFVGRCEAPRDVRLRVRTNRGVEVPIGQQHWPVRSGRQLRRREAGGGAAGGERPGQKKKHVELASARCNCNKSLRPKKLAGETKTGAKDHKKNIPAQNPKNSMDTH